MWFMIQQFPYLIRCTSRVHQISDSYYTSRLNFGEFVLYQVKFFGNNSNNCNIIHVAWSNLENIQINNSRLIYAVWVYYLRYVTKVTFSIWIDNSKCSSFDHSNSQTFSRLTKRDFLNLVFTIFELVLFEVWKRNF